MKIHEGLTTILTSVVITVFLSASYRLINIESTITLLIFNLLFVSLIFQLKGAIIKKGFILMAGNLLGFFCNLLFFNFSYAGLDLFGKQFNAVYTLMFPFLNLIWIVPFWAFSLSLIVEHKTAS